MSNIEATSTAPITLVIVQIATTMDAETKSIQKNNHSKQSKNKSIDLEKPISTPTTVPLFSVIMARVIVLLIA